MLASYARSQYQEMEVQTTPGRLVVMLYDGALRFLHIALDALRRGDPETQGRNLGKAQNILVELMNTLDRSAGQLAVGLDSLYRYCLAKLLTANAEDRAGEIEEVIRLLTTLREAWEQAERAVRSPSSQLDASEGQLVGAAR